MLLRVWETVHRHTDRYAENREGIKSGAYISYPSAGEKHGKFICALCVQIAALKCYLAVQVFRKERFMNGYYSKKSGLQLSYFTECCFPYKEKKRRIAVSV